MSLHVDSLGKSYASADGRIEVLGGVSFSLAAGETLALTGESGSGKSTLLAVLSGLEPFDSGSVNVAGTELSGLDDAGCAALRRGTIGIVFQQFNLIPSLNVGDNIAFQARLAGDYDAAWTADLTERLGLTDQIAKYPEQLSGGQQQRVAIGRTLALRPAVLLADEPTGNLDEDTSLRVLDLMLELSDVAGAALLMVTHSTQLAARLSRRAHLSHGTLS